MTGTAKAPVEHQTETSPGRRSARRRALIAGATGNIVEWFDFTIYGFTAAVLATVFFPPEFGSGALLATFALYGVAFLARPAGGRSEEHTSELQSLMRISYAVFCLKKKTTPNKSN